MVKYEVTVCMVYTMISAVTKLVEGRGNFWQLGKEQLRSVYDAFCLSFQQ